MANNQTPKLRAFIRIDGSGRVIPGAPIFQANKPKVGEWREIPLYYRGDPAYSTTTTTTTRNGTAGGGGSNVTAYVKALWFDPISACNTTSSNTLVFFSASSSLSVGVTVFTDAALTTPVTSGWVISDNMTKYTVYIDGSLQSFGC